MKKFILFILLAAFLIGYTNAKAVEDTKEVTEATDNATEEVTEVVTENTEATENTSGKDTEEIDRSTIAVPNYEEAIAAQCADYPVGGEANFGDGWELPEHIAYAELIVQGKIKDIGGSVFKDEYGQMRTPITFAIDKFFFGNTDTMEITIVLEGGDTTLKEYVEATSDPNDDTAYPEEDL